MVLPHPDTKLYPFFFVLICMWILHAKSGLLPPFDSEVPGASGLQRCLGFRRIRDLEQPAHLRKSGLNFAPYESSRRLAFDRLVASAVGHTAHQGQVTQTHNGRVRTHTHYFPVGARALGFEKAVGKLSSGAAGLHPKNNER